MWTRLGALCLGLASAPWWGGACAGPSDQGAHRAARDQSARSASRDRGSAAPRRASRSTPLGSTPSRSLPSASPDRSGPARPAWLASGINRLTTLGLLDATESLVLPAPARNLAFVAAQRYWRITPYRHSRLPTAQRPVDVLLTLVTRKVPDWLAALAEEEGRAGTSGRTAGRTTGPGMGRASGPTSGPASGPALTTSSGSRQTGAFPPVGLWAGPRKRWPSAVGLHEVRRALLLPAASRWTARAQVPPHTELRLELTPIPVGRAPTPLRVTVSARPLGKETLVLFEQELGVREAGRFLPLRFSLAELGGLDVRFEVAVQGAGGTSPHYPPGGKSPPVRTGGGSPRVPPGFVALVRPRLEFRAQGGPLNVMILILDTVRLDALGSSGQRRVLTPALDALAARGVRFTNAFANASWTRPSLMALLSARHPGAAGSTPMSFFPHEPDLALVRSGVVSTLSDHLEQQGYAVRALAQNYFMLPEEKIGVDLGFSSFAHVLLPGGPHRADNPALTAAAEQFLGAHRDHRFFFYLHYESAHAPYDPPKEVLDELRAHLGPKPRISIEDKYRGEVMALDRLVARLVAALERQGLMDRTLLVVTSDHGETLDRSHCFFLPKLKYNTCYGHSPSLYDEVLRVPLILVGPGLRAGRVVTQTMRHVDLAPTLLDLLGLPPLPGVEGTSVAPWLRGARPDEPRDVYAVGRGVFALRRGQWKYIWRAPMTRKRIVRDQELYVVDELYDLAADPQEHRNLALRRPEVVRELRTALYDLMRKDRFPVGPSAPRLDRRHLPRPFVPPPGVR